MSSERTINLGPKKAGAAPAEGDVRSVAAAPPTLASPDGTETTPVYARPGAMVMGKYRVDRVLGEGGMGLVVAATHTGLDQKVAIKFLHPEAAAREDIVERFAREARAAAKVKSEHVVRIFDVGTLENGAPYMVMEHLEGEDLDQLAEREKKLPLGTVCGFMLQACEALAEAHAAGIVHRDLKPANLFLARGPDRRTIVKVLDFGISKLRDRANALTQTSTLLGTAYYMSPEQLTNAKAVDARSDVWALGVILYELVSGARPFDAGTMPEVVALILSSTPTPLREYVPDVPPRFEAIIDRCLQRNPKQRFASVGELAAELVTFVPEQRVSIERISRVVATMDEIQTGTSATMPAPSNALSPEAVSFAMPPTRREGGVVGLAETALSTAAPVAAVVEAPRAPRRAPLLVLGIAIVAIGLGAVVAVPRLRGTSSAGPSATAPPSATLVESVSAPIPSASASTAVVGAASGSAPPPATSASSSSKLPPRSAPVSPPAHSASARAPAPATGNGNPLDMDIK